MLEPGRSMGKIFMNLLQTNSNSLDQSKLKFGAGRWVGDLIMFGVMVLHI
jgi:hypothetical protein